MLDQLELPYCKEYDLAEIYQEKRLCKEFEVTVIRN
jgi:hypothetical protein